MPIVRRILHRPGIGKILAEDATARELTREECCRHVVLSPPRRYRYSPQFDPLSGNADRIASSRPSGPPVDKRPANQHGATSLGVSVLQTRASCTPVNPVNGHSLSLCRSACTTPNRPICRSPIHFHYQAARSQPASSQRRPRPSPRSPPHGPGVLGSPTAAPRARKISSSDSASAPPATTASVARMSARRDPPAPSPLPLGPRRSEARISRCCTPGRPRMAEPPGRWPPRPAARHQRPAEPGPRRPRRAGPHAHRRARAARNGNRRRRAACSSWRTRRDAGMSRYTRGS